MDFLQTFYLLSLSCFGCCQEGSLGLYAPLCSHAGHHLLLVGLDFDLQLDFGISHLPAMIEQLMSDVDIIKMIHYLCFGILPQRIITVQHRRQGQEARAIDLKFMFLSRNHVEEDNIQRSLSQLITLKGYIYLRQMQFFGYFLLPHQMVAFGCINFQHLFLAGVVGKYFRN